jgi:hypothetical protein
MSGHSGLASWHVLYAGPVLRTSINRLATILVATAAALAMAACGEKSEPDVTSLPPPPAPQPEAPPAGLPTSVKGEWEGTLKQKGVKPFAIGVRIASATDASRNVVNYGGEIDCTGNWKYLDAEGPTVKFEERINRGAGKKCKGTGMVTVRAQGADRLSYEFRGGGVVSRGTLKRRR